eukprot:5118877-Pyramimonas_sp.AAC.1
MSPAPCPLASALPLGPGTCIADVAAASPPRNRTASGRARLRWRRNWPYYRLQRPRRPHRTLRHP